MPRKKSQSGVSKEVAPTELAEEAAKEIKTVEVRGEAIPVTATVEGGKVVLHLQRERETKEAASGQRIRATLEEKQEEGPFIREVDNTDRVPEIRLSGKRPGGNLHGASQRQQKSGFFRKSVLDARRGKWVYHRTPTGTYAEDSFLHHLVSAFDSLLASSISDGLVCVSITTESANFIDDLVEERIRHASEEAREPESVSQGIEKRTGRLAGTAIGAALAKEFCVALTSDNVASCVEDLAMLIYGKDATDILATKYKPNATIGAICFLQIRIIKRPYPTKRRTDAKDIVRLLCKGEDPCDNSALEWYKSYLEEILARKEPITVKQITDTLADMSGPDLAAVAKSLFSVETEELDLAKEALTAFCDEIIFAKTASVRLGVDSSTVRRYAREDESFGISVDGQTLYTENEVELKKQDVQTKGRQKKFPAP